MSKTKTTLLAFRSHDDHSQPFLIAVSGLLIAITVIASLFVAVETKSAITADVYEQKNALRDEVYSILCY